MSQYSALKRNVKGRGEPPDAFLDELVAWARTAPDEIFEANEAPGDVMPKLGALLGPWQGEAGAPERLLDRKARHCELLRCLAGFESSWHWHEGVDTTNRTSMAHVEGQETGIFQVSFDSLNLEHGTNTLRGCLARKGVSGPSAFIEHMKVDHALALEYCARLLRISYQWDGPIKRGEIDSSLSRDAVQEFMTLLA